MLGPVLSQTAVQPTVRVPRRQLEDSERLWLSFDQVWDGRNDCKEKGDREKKLDSCWKPGMTLHELLSPNTYWSMIDPSPLSSSFRIHHRGLAICAFVMRPGENAHISVRGGRLGNSCHIFHFSFKTNMEHRPKRTHTYLLFVDMLLTGCWLDPISAQKSL